MANWCFNYVTFSGEYANINNLYAELKAMAARWKANGYTEGVLPSFSKQQSGWFFDLEDYLLEEDMEDDALQYTTKWCPNLEALKELAQHFKVDFELQYEELGCLLYGKANYDHAKDELRELMLEGHHFDLYEEDGDYWLFEGKRYESDSEILDILLERLEAEQAIVYN